jgi:hypothetical protein
MTIPDNNPDEELIIVKQKMGVRGCAWRLGCLVVWLPLILLPLFLLLLATQGEVALWHNDSFPNGEEHPFVQAKLLMDIDTRGLNVTRSYISSSNAQDTAACVQTNVRFLLWQGEGTPVDYCDCYTRDAAGDAWEFQARTQGVCE